MSKSTVEKIEGQEVYSWSKPQLNDGRPINYNQHVATNPAELEEIRKKAYEEGFLLGKNEGKSQLEVQLNEKTQVMDELIESIYSSVTAQQEMVVKELVNISVIIAKNIIRRELIQENGQIVSVLKEALKLFPFTTKDITIRLSPEDADTIRKIYSSIERQHAWTINEDPAIVRGGCILESETAFVNASIETQINEIYYRLLGGTRDDEIDVRSED